MYKQVNMVIIELYKTHVTHMMKIYILQEIPDLFSYHKYFNMLLVIRRCFIILCMCKILVQNVTIKDISKYKNDVH